MKGPTIDARAKICRNCGQVCANNETIHKHEILCHDFLSCQVVLYERTSNNLTFENIQVNIFLPPLVYLDSEPIIDPISSTDRNLKIAGYCVLQKNINLVASAMQAFRMDVHFFYIYRQMTVRCI